MTERDTHTISVKCGTQILKTELLINTACYFIHLDPSPILFIQPTQGAAEDFSKERFGPTVAATPALRALVKPPRTRDSENMITHKDYPGGSLDFVGANSPTDLASRPKRIVLADEIDKYPLSAGSEGDPLKLGEERASTYKDVGRAKFIRVCSPTVKGESRISREYEASDRRKCFVPCPHCNHEQVLTWAHVRWEKRLDDGVVSLDVPEGRKVVEHHPGTAAIACEECGVVWTERERRQALRDLAGMSDYGWRQTRPFVCCGAEQVPDAWDGEGRAQCLTCGERASYAGHAGFHASKLYSARHALAEIVREFLDAQGNPELLRKFINTALAEDWERRAEGEDQDSTGLIARREPYGPDDLPEPVRVVSGFCDVQGDRLEVQLIGWGADEECWPFVYEVLHGDPAQPHVWKELDALLLREFRTADGRTLRVRAFGIDTGGHHTAQVHAFCRPRRTRRVFACQGISGNKPIWPVHPTRSKSNDPLFLIGVDGAKDAIYARLKIEPPEPGERKPGFIHFPAEPGFGPDYFAQLTSERREVRKRLGHSVTVWELPPGKRNEVLDTFVGALAVRKALPRRIEAALGYVLESARPMPDDEQVDGEPAKKRKLTFKTPHRLAASNDPYL